MGHHNVKSYWRNQYDQQIERYHNNARCVFIHIGIPGQEKGAVDLETFPSMQVFKLAQLSIFKLV